MISKEDLEKMAVAAIEDNKELTDKIQEICNDLMNSFDITNINRYYKHQDILTGIYGTLNPIYKRLRALKENHEVERFNQLKLEADVNGEKFVSEVAKRNAGEYISSLRLARDLLEGYIDACTKAIDTCRSHIYEHQKDKRYDT